MSSRWHPRRYRRDLLAFGLDAQGNPARVPASPPRALTLTEIRSTVEDYARAASNALAAGFDGVEVHAANGYLPHQFMASNVNRRSDGYGGSLEGRCRFLFEVVEAVTGVVPRGRVGVRLSPLFTGNDIADADLIAFGRPFISNPDLPERLRRGGPFTPPDPATFYGGGAEGYTDWPTLDSAAGA